MRLTLLLAIFSFSFFSCQVNDNNHVKYLSQEERKVILLQLAPYTQKPPRTMSLTERLHDSLKEYYAEAIVTGQITLEKYYTIESKRYFLLKRKETGSLFEDCRLMGGYYKVSNDSITDFNISFVSPLLRMDKADETGLTLFNALVEKGHVHEFIFKPEFVEWPNRDVVYDNSKYDWAFKSCSPGKELQYASN